MKLKTIIFNSGRRFFKIPYFEKWLRKLIINNPEASCLYKMIPNNYQYKPNTIRYFKYKGINLKVDIRDYVQHNLYFNFKDKAQEKLISLAKSEFIILDIGTNIGSTLLQFAKNVGTSGFVYGFEPDFLNHKACIENIALNPFSNLEVFNIGLGNEKGTFDLVVDKETNRGENKIQLTKQADKTYTSIHVERLDDWISNQKIEKLNLIKIDVEGFEMNVLKGAYLTIKRFYPILFIEVDDNNLNTVGNSAKELILFLEELNYKITMAETNIAISSNFDFTKCHFDIIATTHYK